MNKIKHIIVRSVLVVLLVAVGGGNLYAQKSQLSGTVSDAENTPLVGASIIVEGTHVGTTTDADGAFRLPAAPGQRLTVSYLGYKSKTVTVTDISQPITVTLDMRSVLLGEVPLVRREINHYLDLKVTDEKGNVIERDNLYIERVWIDEDGEEDSEHLSPEYLDEKHSCRIFWDYDYALQDEDGKPLKEATLRIEADDYDDPVTIKVKYPKRNAKKTIKFKHRKQK